MKKKCTFSHLQASIAHQMKPISLGTFDSNMKVLFSKLKKVSKVYQIIAIFSWYFPKPLYTEMLNMQVLGQKREIKSHVKQLKLDQIYILYNIDTNSFHLI